MLHSKTTFVTVNQKTHGQKKSMLQNSKTTFVTVNLDKIATLEAENLLFKNNFCYC